MDQESGPVTGTDIYGVTEEETRPEEAIRALSETRAVLAERFEGVHRLTRRTLPAGRNGPFVHKGDSVQGGTLPACRPCPSGGWASSPEGTPF
jgi:hypothetical protein